MAQQHCYVLSSWRSLNVHYVWKPMQTHIAEQGQAGKLKIKCQCPSNSFLKGTSETFYQARNKNIFNLNPFLLPIGLKSHLTFSGFPFVTRFKTWGVNWIFRFFTPLSTPKRTVDTLPGTTVLTWRLFKSFGISQTKLWGSSGTKWYSRCLMGSSYLLA